jgi:DNA-binding MarR family transcriptional regulator
MERELHIALMDIVGMLNSPRYDDILLREAGVALDRALFPLLARVALQGPVGIVDLADQVGRDHSTVSRQVAKLEAQGLVSRAPAAKDQRVRAAVITPQGRAVAKTLAAARNRLIGRVLDGWSVEDRQSLARLNGKLAESMKRLGRPGDGSGSLSLSEVGSGTDGVK